VHGPPVNRNATAEFLWKGSPKPSMVQRIGAFLFGIGFLVGGLSAMGSAVEDRSLLLAIPAAGVLFVGTRIFRNGFGWNRMR
jgi:hypothetical protein